MIIFFKFNQNGEKFTYNFKKIFFQNRDKIQKMYLNKAELNSKAKHNFFFLEVWANIWAYIYSRLWPKNWHVICFLATKLPNPFFVLLSCFFCCVSFSIFICGCYINKYLPALNWPAARNKLLTLDLCRTHFSEVHSFVT